MKADRSLYQTPPEHQQAFQQERVINRQVLSEVGTATEIGTLPLFVAARIDPHLKELGWQLGIACGKGCAWCCHGLKVEVTPPEAIAVAEYLRSKAEPEQLPAIGEALSIEADEARSLSIEERWVARRACYFLDEASGACTIWEARPLGCRSHTSLNASACESAHTGRGDGPAVPRPKSIEMLYGVARAALHAACEDAGMDMRAFELTNAVAVAFNVPQAAERWHLGERVFDRAVIPSDESDRAHLERDARSAGVIPAEQLLPQNRSKAANEKKRVRRAQRGR
ncbi:MAG: YkgJ family cysteine cluster protein [Pseudomonadota bacterium]